MARVIKAADVGRAEVSRPVHIRRTDGSLIVVGEVVECGGVLILRPAATPNTPEGGADPDPAR